MGSHGWLQKLVSLCISSLSNIIYLFSLSIIIDGALESPGYGKYVVDGLSARDKRMLKLSI